MIMPLPKVSCACAMVLFGTVDDKALLEAERVAEEFDRGARIAIAQPGNDGRAGVLCGAGHERLL